MSEELDSAGIETRMRGAAATQLLELFAPMLDERERKVIAPAFEVLKRGAVLEPQLAIQVLVSLYEVRQLRKRLYTEVRTAEKLQDRKPLERL